MDSLPSPTSAAANPLRRARGMGSAARAGQVLLAAGLLVGTLVACASDGPGGSSRSEKDLEARVHEQCTEEMRANLDGNLAYWGRYTFTAPRELDVGGCEFGIIADGDWMNDRGEVTYRTITQMGSGPTEIKVGDDQCSWGYGTDTGAWMWCGNAARDSAGRQHGESTELHFYPDENYEGEPAHRIPRGMMEILLVSVHEDFWRS